MDFIERIFGVSPDGDSGLFELLLFVLPLLGLAALVSRRRRPAPPLVVGRDWQAVAVEGISPIQPVLVQLATWSGPPQLDAPLDAVICETRDAVGTEPHEPEGADEQRDAVGAEPPRRGYYRPVARRGPPTDDSVQGDQR